MSDRMRVGVVGHGYFGAFHARHYEAHAEVDLVGIADPGPNAAEVIALSYGDRHVRDYRELMGNVDAVSIAAPTGQHFEIASAFVAAGVHALVEKPLCINAADARALTKAADEQGVVLNVGHIERFSSAYRRLKAELASPRIIEVERHAPWRGRILDVDVVLDVMIHDIDLVLDLVQSEVTGVAASGVDMMGHGLDVVAARVAFANGVTAHISSSRVAPETVRVLRAVEDGRALTLDFAASKLSTFTAAGAASAEETVERVDALRAEIDAFILATRGDGRGGVSGLEGARALDLAERIRAEAG